MGTEILGHESTLQVSISGCDESIQQGHFGSKKIQKELSNVSRFLNMKAS